MNDDDDDDENNYGQVEDDLPVAEPEEIQEFEDHCRDVSEIKEHGVYGGHQRPVSWLRVPGTKVH